MLRLGDKGDGVRTWQEVLVSEGARIVVDGDFGRATHNATLAYQARHGLPTTGVVDSQEWDTAAKLTGRSIPPPPTLPNTIPLVEARFYARIVRRPRLITLHSMEAAEASTTAERCAAYLANLPRDLPKKDWKSTGYCIDSAHVVQCVPDHLVAYHAPGVNEIAIGLEHAGYARQTREEWLDDFGERMLRLSVQLAARLCRTWKIRPIFIAAADLPACVADTSVSGFTTHWEVSQAFHRSTHTDPGPGFPLDWYLDRIAAELVVEGNA